MKHLLYFFLRSGTHAIFRIVNLRIIFPDGFKYIMVSEGLFVVLTFHAQPEFDTLLLTANGLPITTHCDDFDH